MKIVICDPEETYRISIAQMIEKWKETKGTMLLQITAFSSSEDLLEVIEKGVVFDIVFLAVDFQNELNGMETARHIRAWNDNIQIVFLCEHPNFAIQGYSINALRCLCKPIFLDQLFECLDAAIIKQNVQQDDNILLRSNTGKTIFICKSDIMYIESAPQPPKHKKTNM